MANQPNVIAMLFIQSVEGYFEFSTFNIDENMLLADAI